MSNQVEFKEVKLIEIPIRVDGRGNFRELFLNKDWADLFVQDNMSFSVPGVLRGMHWQVSYPQAKLVTVIRGSILDVVVDIRVGSPTFGKWEKFMLIDTDSGSDFLPRGKLLYVPVGFAHGFYALEESIVMYKCSEYYDQAGSRGFRWDDPEIGIRWEGFNPIVSDADGRWPSLKEVPKESLPKYEG